MFVIEEITAIATAVSKYNEKQEQARQTAIETYETNKQTAESLQELYNKYKQLNEITNKTEDDEKNYNQVQKDIVDILKEKYDILKNLTEGTEKYRQAVENLTLAELAQYRTQMISAATAAETNLAQFNIGGYKTWFGGEVLGQTNLKGKSDIKNRIVGDLRNLGIGIDTWNDDASYKLSGFQDIDTAQGSLQNYAIIKKAQDALTKLYNEAIISGDIGYADQIRQSVIWTNINDAISEAQETVDKYLSTQVDLIKTNYIISNGLIKTQEDYNAMTESVLKTIGADEYFNDTILNLIGTIDKYVKVQDEIVDKTETWAQQSAKVLSNYQDILDTINSMRNAEQSILDIEEKRQALEDARKNKNVRVFNAATGTWELQADEKAIAKAEKDYESAVWNNLQNEIKTGNLTVGEIYDKVAAISDDLPELANMIRNVFIDAGYNVPAFDRGGVLQGLGGVKATNGDEIVLDPSITRKILQPTSNEQFSAFVKDLGLLFGVSKQVMNPTSGMVVNNGATNNNDNRTYTVNGIPFTAQDARSYSLAELFETAAQFNN